MQHLLRFMAPMLALVAAAAIAGGIANAAPASPRLLERTDTHVVANGDSLAAIASRYGVPTDLIAAANGLDARASIVP
ncbi:MAG TPA: LysM domain-containing protein, partial [Burkholderiaceae bacterium]|nr:LysM domain-containing protein [Burkholderiaceae bacterium]